MAEDVFELNKNESNSYFEVCKVESKDSEWFLEMRTVKTKLKNINYQITNGR